MTITLTDNDNELFLKHTLETASTLSTSVIYDKSYGYAKILENNLVNYTPNLFLCGPLFLVETNNSILPVLHALDNIPPNHVLLINDISTVSEAILGDIIMLAAKQQNVRGIICLGTVRDVSAAQHLNLPLWSEHVNPKAAKVGSSTMRSFVKEMQIHGSEIRAGDWIFGDNDGLVLLKKERARLVVKAAAMKQKKEDSYKKRMISGKKLTDMMNVSDHINGQGKLIVEF